MGKLAILVTIISLLATACTWRDCTKTTAYAIDTEQVMKNKFRAVKKI